MMQNMWLLGYILWGYPNTGYLPGIHSGGARVPTRYTLWGYTGTYPVYTLGVHGYHRYILSGYTVTYPVYTLEVAG